MATAQGDEASGYTYTTAITQSLLISFLFFFFYFFFNFFYLQVQIWMTSVGTIIDQIQLWQCWSKEFLLKVFEDGSGQTAHARIYGLSVQTICTLTAFFDAAPALNMKILIDLRFVVFLFSFLRQTFVCSNQRFLSESHSCAPHVWAAAQTKGVLRDAGASALLWIDHTGLWPQTPFSTYNSQSDLAA